jgi:hypothetical protein
MPNYPDVNGHRTSFCSVEFALDGQRIPGIKSINYKEELTTATIYGTSSHPVGRTRGQLKFSGDIEFYAEEWYDTVLPILTGGGAIGFSERAVTLTVAYREIGLSTPTIQVDQLMGARIHSPDRSNSEGTEALTVKVALDIMNIRWNSKHQGLRTRTLV